MLSNEGWECPPVDRGDTVDVARNPESMASASSGVVTAVYKTPEGITSLDVLVTKGGGHRLYRAVHHVDDPALKEYPHWLQESASGVFVISKSTQRVRDLLATVNYLKGAINKLVSRVDRLESEPEPEFEPKPEPEPAPAPDPVPAVAAELNEPPPEEPSPEEPVRRKRGRPRKNELESAGAAK